MKVKKQLIYPSEGFDWEKSLASLLKNTRFDRETGEITLLISDPNLLYEIETFPEERGGYISTRINKKLLHISVEYSLEIAILREDEKAQKDIIKEIKNEIKKQIKMRNYLTRKI